MHSRQSPASRGARRPRLRLLITVTVVTLLIALWYLLRYELGDHQETTWYPAAPGCDLHQGPCGVGLEEGERLTLAIPVEGDVRPLETLPLEVRVDGVSLDEADLVYLRNRVNYVNQRTQLFHDTVLKNMQYGNDVSEDEIRKILRTHHLESIFGRLKHGIHSSAGVNGGSLSLGMQKVTILMRGLLRPEARVIILDEPLAGLDAHTRRKVISLIKERSAGKTLIVITHDKEIVPMMDRVVNFSHLNRTTDTSTVDAGAQDSAQTPDQLSSAAMM